MLSAESPETRPAKRLSRRATKVTILLTISLGLLLVSEKLTSAPILEPQSRAWELWYSYAKDLLQPFAFYFFLCLGERWLKTWQWRALPAFAIPLLVEFVQWWYHQFPTGRYVGTFDLMDIVMYAAGVGLAVLLEQKILAKQLNVWKSF